MPDRYKSFRKTRLGRGLSNIAEDSTRYNEYLLLAQKGLPSVGAVVVEVLAHFPETKHSHFAQQALGAFVGTVMYANGHQVIAKRIVKPTGLLGKGAVWTT